MKLKLSCPHGEYREGLRIFCRKTGDLCGNQYFKRCKGWWVLNENAARCPIKREETAS